MFVLLECDPHLKRMLMSEDHTSYLENNTSTAEPSFQSDEALVDRTQQLIDEVHQLLGGTSDSAPAVDSAPAAPATPAPSEFSSQEVAEAPAEEVSNLSAVAENVSVPDGDSGADSHTAATLKSFLDSLVGSESSEPGESTQQVEPAAQAEVAQQAEAAAQFETTLNESSEPGESTQQVEPAAQDEVTQQAEVAAQFETTLNESSEPGESTQQVEPAAQNEATQQAEAAAQTAPQFETASQVEVSSLEGVSTEAEIGNGEVFSTIDMSTFANTVAEPAAPAAEVFEPEAEEVTNQEVTTEQLTQEVTTEEVASIEAPVEPEFEYKPTLEAEDVAESHVSADSPVSEVEPLEDERSITQKYLDEMRNAFDDEPETTEEPEQIEQIEQIEQAEQVEQVEQVEHVDSVVEEDNSDDPDVPSVESWLAANIGQTAAVEAVVEEAVTAENDVVAEEPVTVEDSVSDFETPTSAYAAEDVADVDVPDVDGSVVEEEVVSDSDAVSEVPLMKTESTETCDFQNDGLEGGSLDQTELARFQASVESRFDGLESRIVEMFALLKGQIAQSGIALPQVDSVVADELESNDGESDSPTSETNGEDDTVDSLKEQLKAKLREAEMELSINRAKVSQEKAAIERMQADLESREATVEAKLQQIKSGDKKGLMDRWKRHMGE